jgi:hypothetical protein
MPGTGEISTADLVRRKLDGLPEPGFDCGREDQNAFLYERAWEDQRERLSVTYLYYIHGMLAGYATVCPDGLLVGRRERGFRIRYESVGA